MLENAVASVGPLRIIKYQYDQHFSHSGREITYEQFSNLLLSADNNYDIKFYSSGSRSSRKVYATDSNNNNFSRDSISDFTEEHIDYDIDASASTLLIDISNESPNAYMPKDDFSALIFGVRHFLTWKQSYCEAGLEVAMMMKRIIVKMFIKP